MVYFKSRRIEKPYIFWIRSALDFLLSYFFKFNDKNQSMTMVKMLIDKLDFIQNTNNLRILVLTKIPITLEKIEFCSNSKEIVSFL